MDELIAVDHDGNKMIAISQADFLQDTVYLIELLKEALAVRKICTGNQQYVDLFRDMNTVMNMCTFSATYEIAITGLGNFILELTEFDAEKDHTEFLKPIALRARRNLQFLVDNFN
jgi:hypothetical protein